MTHPFSFANVTDHQIANAVMCDECRQTLWIMGDVTFCERCTEAFKACQEVRDDERAAEAAGTASKWSEWSKDTVEYVSDGKEWKEQDR